MIEWTDFGCVHKSGRHELRMFMENQIEKYSCKAREKNPAYSVSFKYAFVTNNSFRIFNV